jgi:hypothetical protein
MLYTRGTMRRPLAAALVLLCSSPVLAAELAGSLRLGAGMGVAPDRNEELLLTGAARGQLGAVLEGMHGVYAAARVQPLRDLRLGSEGVAYLVGASYERRFALYQGWRPTLGLTVGLSGATELCQGDSCGESGPAAGFELGVQRMLGRRSHFALSAELMTQVSTGTNEGTLLLPTLWAGIGF